MERAKVGSLRVGQRFETLLTRRKGKVLERDQAMTPADVGVDVVMMAGPAKTTGFEVKQLHPDVVVQEVKP